MRWAGEAEAGFPYWWDGLLREPSDAGLPARCDVLVIGAGYTGLSAALAAHECGARVAVVDAGEPGAGASSRNGGMFGAHPRLSWEALAQRFGADVADGVLAEATPALHFVKDLIKAEEIDCDLQQTGRIQLAWSEAHLDGQRRLAERVRAKSDVDVRIVEHADLAQEIATQCYYGGILFPEHCAIHPAKFHHGLLRAAQRRDIPVVAEAGVTQLEREGTGFVAQTAKGCVRADKVVLATNGYTTPAFRWHLARVFPLPSYMIATEELPANLLGHLAPGRRMMVETLSYFRDIGFLLFGFTGAYFTYRAWRQREDEIKEKYFDRRFALYCIVDEAAAKASSPGMNLDFDWWQPLIEAKRQAKFLVGNRAQESVGRLLEHATEYSKALEIRDTDSRVAKAKVAREEIAAELVIFRLEMERYLTVV